MFMTEQPYTPVPDDGSGNAPKGGFWRSRSGLSLIVALALGGLLLGYEHRVHILGSGWLIYLPLLICVGMHFFMHGDRGGHGGRKGGSGQR
ncbi:DUF2933 domain-containing protein [Defluviimonas sp. CAU 1641]|uniref:DUF2933 domain-containing protein n=2 Tax=Defluviimonas salinarum TaxID=2992147 RepID=A0ABT3J5B2_9RHOB|nr:DUF2933 domain-containing protein [Defluviimonas salinarum]